MSFKVIRKEVKPVKPPVVEVVLTLKPEEALLIKCLFGKIRGSAKLNTAIYDKIPHHDHVKIDRIIKPFTGIDNMFANVTIDSEEFKQFAQDWLKNE